MPVFRTVVQNGEVRLERIDSPKDEEIQFFTNPFTRFVGRRLWENNHPGRIWRGPRLRRLVNRPSRWRFRRGKRVSVSFTRIL